MNEIKEHLKAYHSELVRLYQTGITKELSFRTPLENLFNALKPTSYTIIQESEAKENGAKPDFDIYKRVDKKDELSYNALVGFIECKDIDKDLDAESKQIQRYLQISPNIILTNYRRFILLSFGKVIDDITLFDEQLNEHLFSSSHTQDFFKLVKAFFDDTNTQIKSKSELVKVLSSQSFYLAIALKNAYDDKSQISSFHEFFDKTLATFQAIEKVEFSELDFCDTLAQSIVYGLFVSFVENENLKLEKIPTTSFIDLLPKYFKTLNEFIYFSLPTFDMPQNVIYVLDNVKKTLALLDKASIAKFLNLELENIAIYLYEDFLKEYDELRSTQKRKQGGVFYTPQAVVKMIVSTLDELLQSKFGKKQGFLDEEVKVLDFATGTGSFLATVFKKIIDKEKEAFKNDTIKNKFLKDIYGFELSFVAYIVARLKLGQILKKEGFSDFSDADFQIYLNNTLDLSQIANYTMSMPLINLDNEWQKARNVKHSTNLLVILGNPPYNVKSKNKGKEILELLQSYKQGLNETNIQPLDDDYIKFIRFAQWKLLEQNAQNSLFDTQNKGLLGFITNNSFLDGRTHRKMRQSLARAFDEIYILNLHGDSGDENVFDIRVGVCISLFVKYKDTHNDTKLSKIFYYSTNDNGILKRNDKFVLLNSIAQNGLNSVKWQELKLDEPYFWFVPKSFENDEYENFWALAGDRALGESKAIFENFSSGVENKRNSISICFNKTDLEQILSDFCELSITEIKSKYGLEENNINVWIEKAKADIRSMFADKNLSLNDKTLKSPLPCGGGLGVGIKTDKSPSHRPLAPYMKEFSRAMRKNPTQAENKLWQELRSKKLGFGFRRQFVIDSKYIADFVCLEKRLIIECDGGQHATINTPPQTPPARGGAYSTSPSLAEGLTSTHSPSLAEGDKGGGYDINHPDIERNFYLESQNFRILRFWNNEILENLEGVLSMIKEALNDDNFASAKFTHPLTPSAREGEINPKYKDILKSKIVSLAFHPFDFRYTFYSDKQGFLRRACYETMQHFIKGENLGLCFPKTCLNSNFDYGLIVDTIADRSLGGANSGSETYIAPLYRYDEATGDKEGEVGKIKKNPNFTPEFKEFIAKSKVLKDKSEKQILAFIYANLFNPAYRKKYLEYLKIGFPRVNFEVNESEFETFAKIGQRLIDLHLLKNIPNDKNIDFEGKFDNKDDYIIQALSPAERYEQNKLKLNKNIAIKGITQDIYTYTIGGYEVIKQWLKYRKNYQASRKELEHLVNVACIIKETIKIQNELENLAKKDKK